MKFVEDALVCFGKPTGPDPSRPLMTGVFARAIAPVCNAAPDPNIASVTVVERRFPSVRLRSYHPAVGGHIWVSRGFMVVSLLEVVRLWWSARRNPIPRARVHR